ncbi:hypothetical protein STAS_06972 [Striga asiatica]|uniref:Uncharacterized protein n=1 Tax=Striga asiatica TaxID=4170 RepID=A0A5A7PDH8_STRAF|nr:hypothetical protein STAS_06972 [Striga asiatica]
MSYEKVRKQNKLIRIIIVPIRVLARARDFYLTSLAGLGGAATYGNFMGCPTPTITRSLSVSSNSRTAEEQRRDLARLRSVNIGKDDDVALRRSKSARPLSSGVPAAAVPRSRTVAFGRIDEDKVFEYEEDEVGLLGRAVDFSRARSYGGRSKRS